MTTAADEPVDRATFERQRIEHSEDHDRERTVARETAQRIEREVDEKAKRLERQVDEVAVRIEKAVQTALTAVAQTAQVHADAHAKEHVAHERIHTVEKAQVDKAEVTQREAATVLSKGLDRYKAEANEWRGSLRDQEAKYLRREEASITFGAMQKDIRQNTDAMTLLRETVISQFAAQTGKTEGLSATAKIVVGAAGLLVSLLTIAAIVVAFTRG